MDIDQRLRLRHLRTFLEVARCGSVAAAAEVLGVTQPAVSKTLRELEDILGAELFDRSERRLRLNAAGQSFQKFVGGALADISRAQRAVQGGGGRVKLSVGLLPSAATDLAPRAALRFREENSHCVIYTLTGPNWLLLSQLREGRLDLVVGRMAAPSQMKGLHFEQLYSEDIVLVVRPGHPLAEVDDVGAALADWPMIVPPQGALIREPVEGFLMNVGLAQREHWMESVSLAFCRGVLLRSDAVWFISRGVVADELRDNRLVALKLSHPVLAGVVGVSMREGERLFPERDALIEALRHAASEKGEGP